MAIQYVLYGVLWALDQKGIWAVLLDFSSVCPVSRRESCPPVRGDLLGDPLPRPPLFSPVLFDPCCSGRCVDDQTPGGWGVGGAEGRGTMYNYVTLYGVNQ